MSVELRQIEELIAQIEKLAPVLRLQLVHRVLHSLLSKMTIGQPSMLRFGEFTGDESQMSTDDDFAMTAWELAEKDAKFNFRTLP